MTRAATKKSAAKKSTTKKPAARQRPDSGPQTCVYCQRDATHKRADTGRLLCDRHTARAMAAGRQVEAL